MANAWKVRDEELMRLKKENEELRIRPFIQSFCNGLGQNLLLLLSQKRYEDWPNEAKIAFAWEAEKAPTIAYLWKNRLPQ